MQNKNSSLSNATGKNDDQNSKSAEGLAVMRALEATKTEKERICFDPYAFRFINKELAEYIDKHYAEFKARLEKSEQMLPGNVNAMLTRVRHFDTIVETYMAEGLEQLVILGAGYDSRAYRIEGLDKRKVFEVDSVATQKLKMAKVIEIFGYIPAHVTFVQVDFETENFGIKLREKGYDTSKKTLFTIEGLLCYLTPETVEKILRTIVQNSVKGSAIIFDYVPLSLVDGTCNTEIGKNMRKIAAGTQEFLKFGIKEETVENFLTEIGFTVIKKTTCEDCKKMYFQNNSISRKVSNVLSFVYAII